MSIRASKNFHTFHSFLNEVVLEFIISSNNSRGFYITLNFSIKRIKKSITRLYRDLLSVKIE